MFQPNVQEQRDRRRNINEWHGYNHNPVLEDGELYDCHNVTGDHFPLLSPRAPRRSWTEIVEILDPITVETVGNAWDEHTYTMEYCYDLADIVMYTRAEFRYNTQLYHMDDEGYGTVRVAIADQYTHGATLNGEAAPYVETSISGMLTDQKSVSSDEPEDMWTVLCPVDLASLFEEAEEINGTIYDSSIRLYVLVNHVYDDTVEDGTAASALNTSYNLLDPSLSCSPGVADINGLWYGDGSTACIVGDTLILDDYIWDFGAMNAGFLMSSGSYTSNYEPVRYFRKRMGGRYAGWQQIVQYGAYLLVFPIGIYINMLDHNDKGTLGAWACTQGNNATFDMCDASGTVITATPSSTAPANPDDGDVWVYIKDGDITVSKWYDTSSAWLPIDVYIKMSSTSCDTSPDDLFKAGDTVRVDTTNPATILVAGEDTNQLQIREVGSGYIIFEHNWPAVGITACPVWVSREMPLLDYVCVTANRVWGCYYGDDANGQRLNEIYSSKQADPTNWKAYAGFASDSYAVSIGSGGKWTGCICYQGLPTFFKENRIYKIYGDYPANYQLQEYETEGVQDGSANSLAVCDQYLFFKSPANVCVFDGSRVRDISAAFGVGRFFTDAAAGVCLTKYYISMKEGDASCLYVYDTRRGYWYKDDDIDVNGFAYDSTGNLLAALKDRIVCLENLNAEFTLPGEDTERYVEWYAETGDIGYNSPEHVRVNRLTIRASIPYHADLLVEISCDDAEYIPIDLLRGDDHPRTQSLEAYPIYTDHFRVRFTGHGDAKVYTMTCHYTQESEEG